MLETHPSSGARSVLTISAQSPAISIGTTSPPPTAFATFWLLYLFLSSALNLAFLSAGFLIFFTRLISYGLAIIVACMAFSYNTQQGVGHTHWDGWDRVEMGMAHEMKGSGNWFELLCFGFAAWMC
ncbi:hypothetical protein BKA64DRAFT_388250 [Cadophora sp. MPI-SDFR-AT-0126]|nr:hypothetical protein BKA64DRAFT_388250 [Leotiomycetes sp. MPI-SDFR-AT-0126]